MKTLSFDLEAKSFGIWVSRIDLVALGSNCVEAGSKSGVVALKA
jgi:hypothetical protein